MKTMTLAEFQQALMSQGVQRPEDFALVCPMCGTVQSARDLIAAGAGSSMNEVERYLGFSCVGRFTGARQQRRQPDGQPCNWTLGGLLQTHKLEVVTPGGVKHPRFELATAEQAQAHAAALVATAESALP